MKKFLPLLLALTPMLFMCSCRSHVEVNGKSYDALTERETFELVLFARETLIKNSPLAKKTRRAPNDPTLLSTDEAKMVRSTEPELKIDYRGDCYGEAVVIWDMPKRKYEVVIEGMFNETSPFKRDVMVRIMKKHGPVLDFRDSQRKQRALAPRP